MRGGSCISLIDRIIEGSLHFTMPSMLLLHPLHGIEDDDASDADVSMVPRHDMPESRDDERYEKQNQKQRSPRESEGSSTSNDKGNGSKISVLSFMTLRQWKQNGESGPNEAATKSHTNRAKDERHESLSLVPQVPMEDEVRSNRFHRKQLQPRFGKLGKKLIPNKVENTQIASTSATGGAADCFACDDDDDTLHSNEDIKYETMTAVTTPRTIGKTPLSLQGGDVILRRPSLSISKVKEGSSCEREQQAGHRGKTTNESTTLLAVSVKKSWLNDKVKARGEDAILYRRRSNGEESSTLSALVAERDEQIEKEMEILIDTILFKLKNQNARGDSGTDGKVDKDSGTDDSYLQDEVSSVVDPSNCTNIDLQSEAEKSLEAFINELDFLKCPFLDLNEAQGNKGREEDVLGSLHHYVTDSVKSVHVPSILTKSKSLISSSLNVGTSDKGLVQVFHATEIDESDGEEREEGYDIGAYTLEAATYMYDDTTLESTLDYTLDTYDETLGGDTFDGTLDMSVPYENEDFDAIMKLLKVRAAHQGISEENLWERIHSEQKKREGASSSSTLIEV